MNLNIDLLFKKYVPIIIGLAVVILIGTFLGPFGIVVVLGVVYLMALRWSYL